MSNSKNNLGWYPFYPGDYARDTRSLSLVEHGAYRLLIDYYFSNSGLPEIESEDDFSRFYRICGAVSQKEKKAVDFILTNFFKKNSSKFIHLKIEILIQKQAKNYKQKIEASYKARALRDSSTLSRDVPNDTSSDTSPDKPNDPSNHNQNQNNKDKSLLLKKCIKKDFEFENFWELYGKIGNKQQAFKKFEKLKKEIGYETIIESHNKYQRYCESQPWYHKQHCATWLNGGYQTEWRIEEKNKSERQRFLERQGLA